VDRFRLIPVAAVVVALAGCGQSGSVNSAGRAPATNRTCSTSRLAVWLGLGEGDAAAGSTYYPLELTNVSRRTCRLFGFLGVSAVGWTSPPVHQLGSAAQRNWQRRPHTVTLRAGATAHASLQLANVANFPVARCKPAEASGLRVFPPDQRRAAEIPFRFRACSAKGPVFLSVEPIQPGVGVPGH
jgi:hypothetical protein